MLVIVFCERVFYANVTPIGRNFAYRESKNAFRGAVCFCASALQKREKSAVEITQMGIGVRR